jgi:NAD(P)-dependent dehydrogenase (short-subunit alcohol dehydrogenase family)
MAYKNCSSKFATILTNSCRGEEDAKALEDNLNTYFQTNVVGNIHLFNIFLPLIKIGQTKKIVTISTGMADIDVAVDLELVTGAAYSISKAAMNMAIAKFHAEFKPEGIIFIGVCPGNVNTGHYENSTLNIHAL